MGRRQAVQPSSLVPLQLRIGETLESSLKIRIGSLLAGLILSQAILFWPSLLGQKILLPLDILTQPGVYFPSAYGPVPNPHNSILADLVTIGVPDRNFSAGEFRSGRWPLWNPMSYSGAPFAGFGKYSPFELVYIAFPSPVTLAWMQLIKSIAAGVGAYLFFRRVLGVHAFPALVGAWCFPLTGIFMYWVGYELPSVCAWLPWLLTSVWQAVKYPWGWGLVGVSIFTCFTLISGHLDIAGQVLLVSGAFGLFTLFSVHGWKLGFPIPKTAGVLVAGWGVGLALAAPYYLPLMEYARTGDRVIRRMAGEEERPPGHLSNAMLIIFPNFYGSDRNGFIFRAVGNQLESASQAYTGLLAALLLAPLAWLSHCHRGQTWFWTGVGVFALGWQLGLPGLVQILRLPLLNTMSHSRFVFATSFAILTLAVVGLDVLATMEPASATKSLLRRWSYLLPVGVLVVLGGICLYLAAGSLEEFRTRVAQSLAIDRSLLNVQKLVIPYANQVSAHLMDGVFCLIAIVVWIVIGRNQRTWASYVPVIGIMMVGELLIFAWNINPQCDPKLYFPRLPALEQLANAPPGRVLCVNSLPANLHATQGLRDIRGYDAIDSHRYVELLELARDKSLQPGPSYAKLQSYTPAMRISPETTPELPRIIDMLNVRYLIVQGSPGKLKPLYSSTGYCVIQNSRALPRAFVPRHIISLPAGASALTHLEDTSFDPGQTAYVEGGVELPVECIGKAEILSEIPNKIDLSVEMQTPGLVILADCWDAGWHAAVDGQPAPILRTNHVLRGVVVPAGRSQVEFRYEPASLYRGLAAMAVGLCFVLAWSSVLCYRACEALKA